MYAAKNEHNYISGKGGGMWEMRPEVYNNRIGTNGGAVATG